MTTATLPATILRVFDETDPGAPRIDTTDREAIARELAAIGCRFERWEAAVQLPRDADQVAILAAYAGDVKRLMDESGYKSVDVLTMKKGTPNTEPIRAKFLSEHTHDEDEIRFFVEGSASFYLRKGGRVYQTICVRGDLLGVPAQTTHWFDMGSDPEFTAIRFFMTQAGWVAKFTGDPIAERFPKLP
jgi:1,2-dihydroxy-3-keto-5-methylthiopentene dioxygenase